MIKSQTTMDDAMPPRAPRTNLLRNWISFIGVSIFAAGLTSFVLLFLVQFSGGVENPYSDLVTYIFVPSVMGFGLAVAGLGTLIERRRRRYRAHDEVPAYPIIDLNDATRRRKILVMLCLAFI